jgi:hypothetical protein
VQPHIFTTSIAPDHSHRLLLRAGNSHHGVAYFEGLVDHPYPDIHIEVAKVKVDYIKVEESLGK